jgi:hypothetical protein
MDGLSNFGGIFATFTSEQSNRPIERPCIDMDKSQRIGKPVCG